MSEGINKSDLLNEINALVESDKIIELKEYMQELHPRDIAEILIELEDLKKTKVFEVLSWDLAGKVLDELDFETFSYIFEKIDIEQKKRLLDLMSQDDMVDLLSEMKEKEQLEIINLLDEDDKEDIKELLVYDEDTAGGIMTTDYISVKDNVSVYQAIEELRENAPEAETIY